MNKHQRGKLRSFYLVCLLAILLLPMTVVAQENDLPRMINTASIGELVLFYPDGWQLDNTDRLQLVQDDDTPITITARILETDPIDPEGLPNWMLTELLISPTASVTPVSYGGVEGWIAQGAFLFEPGIFSAIVVLPVSPERVAVIRIDSLTTEIGEDAPLITAILEKLIILPNTANDETTVSAEVTSGDEFTIETFITAAETLNLETPAQQEVRDFLVNGEPARMQLTSDRISGMGVLTLTRPLIDEQVLVMRVAGAAPQALVDNLAQLQALFATLNLDSTAQ